MRDAVMAKFSQNEELEKLLLSTGSKRLVEHSTDSYCAPVSVSLLVPHDSHHRGRWSL